ncbi:hypothetical protein [Paraglaciecola sp. MB-3u-78]|jgi:hypothetical protein|nr:hypothetical protein [Paraglaciecola sp. MB-3u-78]
MSDDDLTKLKEQIVHAEKYGFEGVGLSLKKVKWLLEQAIKNK